MIKKKKTNNGHHQKYIRVSYILAAIDLEWVFLFYYLHLQLFFSLLFKTNNPIIHKCLICQWSNPIVCVANDQEFKVWGVLWALFLYYIITTLLDTIITKLWETHYCLAVTQYVVSA